MTNRHGPEESLNDRNLSIDPSDLPDGAGLRPLSVEPGRSLRDEAVHELTSGVQARPWYSVVSEFRSPLRRLPARPTADSLTLHS